jgi:hypothetical protein
MEENIKKPRRFLKMLGRVGEIIAQEALLKILRGVVNRIGGKKNLPSILFLFLSVSLFAQYPSTGNKQRLGYQTTGDGLVWRGRASDTVSLKSSTINNAYIIIDTLTNVMYNYIKTKGGWLFNNADTVIINNNFTQPVDSLFFKINVSTNNVDTAKMRWDSDLGTVVLGMYDKVPNELGFKNFWLVKNQTGSTITKNSLVYASGTVGSSGRISVSKFIANGTIDPIYLLGITAHDLTDGEDGYVISYGKIRQVNTDTFAAGSILYPSPTTAGVWTDVEPVAPNIDLPIGFCVNSSSNNGTIAIRVASGFSLSELHDVAISSPSANASLYYSGGLWRDTTASLLVSDTASMLTNYLRTGVAASTYLTQSNAASTYLPLTGGTLTGLLKNTSQRLTGNITISDFDNTYSSVQTGPSSSATVNLALQQNLGGAANISMGGNQGGGGITVNPNIYFTDNRKAYASIGGIHTSLGTDNQSGHIIFTTTPSLNTVALTERMRITQDGDVSITNNTTIGGTTTMSGALTVNNATVLNEGSGDFDTRIESDGNANMVFVDASTDRVGIGTNTPSKTLDVIGDANISGNLTEGGNNVMTNLDTVSLSNRINGKVGLTGDDIISGTKTFNNLVNLTSNLILSGSYSQTNKLLGKNSSNGVGNITVGSGLNLTSDVLTATQIDTTSLSNRIDLKLNKTDTASLSNRINNKVGLTGNETIAGEKTLSNILILNGGLKGQIEKKSGSTVGSFDAIDATTITYIFEHTGSGTGSVILEYLDNPSNHTNRIINIINVSDNDWDMTFDTRKPYIKTSTQINQVEYGQSITVQSDGSKWWVISRNF